MANSATAAVVHKNLMDLTKVTFSEGASASQVEAILKVPVWKVEVDVMLPEDADVDAATTSAKTFVSKFQKQVAAQLGAACGEIVRLHGEDQNGDKQAYSKADGVLSKLNKYLEDMMEDFRVELREAIAKGSEGKIKAKQLQTIGKSSCKSLSILRGVFKSEVDYSSDEDDVAKDLLKKGWQHFGIAWLKDEGRVSISSKKKIADPDLKQLKKAFQESVKKKGAKVARGMLNAQGKNNVVAQILESEGTGLGPKLGSRLLKNALRDQADAGKAAQLMIVKEYSADGGDEDGENGEDKGKGKPPKTDAKVKKKAAPKRPEKKKTAKKKTAKKTEAS